jgi:hypothetical protein
LSGEGERAAEKVVCFCRAVVRTNRLFVSILKKNVCLSLTLMPYVKKKKKKIGAAWARPQACCME